MKKHFYSFFAGASYALASDGKYWPALFLLHIIGFSFFASVVLKKINKRENIFLSVVFFGLGTYVAGFNWIPYTLSTFGNIPFPFNHLIGVLFSQIIWPHLWILSLLIYFVAQKTKWNLKKSFSYPVSLACFLALLEFLTPQVFPLHQNHPWLALHPFLGLVPVFGPLIFSFFSYWLALEIMIFSESKVFRTFPTFIAFLFISLNVFLKIPIHQITTDKPLKIRIVQPNVGNHLKLKSEMGYYEATEEVSRRHERLSFQSSNSTDLIIWPETAHPQIFQSYSSELEDSTSYVELTTLLKGRNTELFFGGYDQNETRNFNYHFQDQYNSAFHFGVDGTFKKVYHKRQLIPFGETLPFGSFNETLSRFLPQISFFAEGKEYDHFQTKFGYRFISPICYEVLDTGFIRDYLNSSEKEADFIVNLTNDSWYGNTNEPYQHLFLAKWRALEFNIPIVRSTNTGITSLIYPNGRESKRTKINEQETLDVVISNKRKTPTIYQKWGHFWSIMFIAFLIFIEFFLKRRREINK